MKRGRIVSTSKIELVRSQVPVTQRLAYLNTGSVGPLPTFAGDAIGEALRQELDAGRVGQAAAKRGDSLSALVRAQFSDTVGASPDAIALTHSTGEGMNIALWSIDWESGDEVLTTNIEHSAASIPLSILARRRGILIREVDLGLGDADAVAALAASIGPRSRMLVVSHVSYSTGALLPVAEIGKLARENDLRFVVDGAQAVGAIPVDVGEIGADFYSIPGQKWLCGPQDVGALWVNLQQLTSFDGTFAGYRSNSESIPGATSDLHPDARRFEIGDRSVPLLAGQAASLDWLRTQVSMRWIHERVARLTDHARRRLSSVAGLRILTPATMQAGLLSFQVDGWDSSELVLKLAAEGFILRWILHPYCVRVSCGFYNTESEIDRLACTVENLRR